MDKETKMNAIFIMDIVGRPPEHLVETLERIIGEMGKEKGVVIISKDIKEPVIMKDQKDFYTSFAEIEVEVDEILILVGLMFKYMPAHVEIISPEILGLSNNSFGEILSEITRRLHGYDEVARTIQIEKQILFNKINELGGKIPEGISPVVTPFVQEEQKKDSSGKKISGKKKKKN